MVDETSKRGERHSGWMEHIVAPLVVGLVVLIGQALVQPMVSESVHTRTERWNAKRAAFASTLAVVDKQLAAHPLTVGPDGTTRPVQRMPEPSFSEINSAYDNLVLFADNRDIVDAFLGCFGARKGQTVVMHDERVRLLRLMRAELGFSPLKLEPEDVRFWVRVDSAAEEITR